MRRPLLSAENRPKPSRSQPQPNNHHEADTRSLPSAPSLAYSDSTADSVSVSTEFSSPQKPPGLKPYEPAIPNCIHTFQLIHTRSQKSTACQTCHRSNGLVFECTRCEIRQCLPCDPAPRILSTLVFGRDLAKSVLPSAGDNTIKDHQPVASIDFDHAVLSSLSSRTQASEDEIVAVIPSRVKILLHRHTSFLPDYQIVTAAEVPGHACYVAEDFIAAWGAGLEESVDDGRVYITWQSLSHNQPSPSRMLCEVMERAQIKNGISLILGKDREQESDYLDILEAPPEEITDSISSGASSTDESLGTDQDFIEQRKRQYIQDIASEITQRLRLAFEQAQENAVEAAPRSSENGNTSRGTAYQTVGGREQPIKKRRRDGDSNNECESDDDDDSEPPNAGVHSKKGKGREVSRFACPYFKYNPSKYQRWPNCPGPGWLDVHRVKEHLYRKHRQPKFRCMRCFERFQSEQVYVDHQRAPVQCELRDPEIIEGFDADQEKQLRSRKKKSHVISEVDKWRATFQILFPHVLADEIPSPFYEYAHSALTECEEYVLRELPLRLQQILDPEFDRALQIVQQSYRIRAIGGLRVLIASIFQDFRKRRQQDTVPAMATELIVSPSDVGPSSSQAQPSYSNLMDILDDIDFTHVLVPDDENMAIFGDVQLEDIETTPARDEGSMQRFSDSGYASNNLDLPDIFEDIGKVLEKEPTDW